MELKNIIQLDFLIKSFTMTNTKWIDTINDVLYSKEIIQHPFPDEQQLLEYKNSFQTMDVPLKYRSIQLNTLENYLLFRVDKDKTLIIGPYKTIVVDNSDIEQYMKIRKLPFTSKKILADYFEKLPYIVHQKISAMILMIQRLLASDYIEPQYMDENLFNVFVNLDIKDKYVLEFIKDTIEAPYHLESSLRVEQLIKAIKEMSKKEFIGYIKKIGKKEAFYRYPQLSKKDDMQSFKNNLIKIVSSIATGINQSSIPITIIDNTANRLIIAIQDHLNSIETLESFIFFIFLTFHDLYHEYKYDNYSLIIRKLIDYIDVNILEKITLKEAACYLKVHPNHLSRTISKELGYGFSTLVNMRKVEVAKSLLEKSNKSIVEISTELNYSTPSYFGVMFKKHANMTPAAYREKSQGSNAAREYLLYKLVDQYKL